MSKCIKVEALGIGYANPDVFENKAYAEGWNSAVKIIKEAEIIDAESVRHGCWEEYSVSMRVCSLCGKHTAKHNFKYCPNCGAKMDKYYVEGKNRNGLVRSERQNCIGERMQILL